MWICMNDAFLSIVRDRNNKRNLLVRARVKGHIEALFPDVKVLQTRDADYLYRASIPAIDVADALFVRVHEIKYDDFKSSVKDKNLHDVYLKFWGNMNSLQHIEDQKRRANTKMRTA